jgi:hypothetical protein
MQLDERGATPDLTRDQVGAIRAAIWKHHLLRLSDTEIRVIAGRGLWSSGVPSADKTIKRIASEFRGVTE